MARATGSLDFSSGHRFAEASPRVRLEVLLPETQHQLPLSACFQDPATKLPSALPAEFTGGRAVLWPPPHTIVYVFEMVQGQPRLVCNCSVSDEREQLLDARGEQPQQPQQPQPQPPQQPQLQASVRVRLPGADALPDKGTLYAIAGGNKPGIYLNWSEADTAHYNQHPNRKLRYNTNNTQGGEVYCDPERCYLDAMDFLASRLPAAEAGQVRQVLDARAAAAEQARQEQERAEAAQRERWQREAAERAAEQERRAAREAEARAVAAAAATAREEAAQLVLGTILDEVMPAARRSAVAAAHREAATAAAAAAEAEAGRRQAEATAAAKAAAVEAKADQVTEAVCDRIVDEIMRAADPYPRDQPDGARSKEAKARRFAKLDAKKAARERQQNGEGASGPAHEPQTRLEQQLRESQQREAALERQLEAREAQVRQERRRSRRDAKTAAKRAAQSERRNGKAAARKRKAGQERRLVQAVRKEDERVRKRKQPAGPPLHTGERLHRQRLDAARRG